MRKITRLFEMAEAEDYTMADEYPEEEEEMETEEGSMDKINQIKDTLGEVLSMVDDDEVVDKIQTALNMLDELSMEEESEEEELPPEESEEEELPPEESEEELPPEEEEEEE